MRRPPRLLTWLLDRTAPARDREALVGDLVEEHALIASTAGAGGAARWYWNQALFSLAVAFPAAMLGGLPGRSPAPAGAGALAVLTALLGVVSLVATGDRAPLWYQVVLIAVGPAGVLLGGRLGGRRPAGQRA